RDALGRVTKAEYDEYNRRVAVVHERTQTGLGDGPPLAPAITRFEHDKNGNLVAVIDALGRVTRHVFDARDRLRSTMYPDESVSGPRYALADHPISTTDPNGLRRIYPVDALGRTERIDNDRTAVPPSVTVEGETYTAFRYDGLGRVVHEENDLAQGEIHYD